MKLSTTGEAGERVDFSLTGRRVWVTGHRGMVGSAIVRRLESEDCTILTIDRRTLDLRNPSAVTGWMERERPDVVVVAAAKVGGILANSTWPADFLYDNLMIEASLIHGAHAAGVRKLLFLGSSCIYPKMAPQPIPEEALLTGPLEPTNEWYALAKITGIKLCQAYRQQHGADFISAMPTNLYGFNDNFHPQNSHVLPALIRRIHEAKQAGAEEVVLWGTGTPRRELLFVDDLADACVHLLKHYSGASHINVGTGEDVTIRELAEIVARVVGFTGRFVQDLSKPDGTPRKVLDVSRLHALGWRHRVGIEDGIDVTYRWFLEHAEDLRAV